MNYEAIISAYQQTELLTFWEAVRTNRVTDWEAGKAFEYLILRSFQIEGAQVRWPFNVYSREKNRREVIEQIDGAVYINGLACLIECKDQIEPVNIEPIAKLRNQLWRRPSATIGIFFSKNGFTEPAITLAQFTAPQTILLWKGEELDYALKNSCMCSGLMLKYQRFIEEGYPDYDIQIRGIV